MLRRRAALSLEQFWGAIAKPMGIDHTDVDSPTTLRGDLGLDSLDIVELLTIMEDLDSTVADHEMASLESVGDLYAHYRSHVGGVTP